MSLRKQRNANRFSLGEQSQRYRMPLIAKGLRHFAGRVGDIFGARLRHGLGAHHRNVNVLENAPWRNADHAVRGFDQIIALAAAMLPS